MINELGVYGVIEMLQANGGLRQKYPTEVTAASHIYNPRDPQFIAAPTGTRRKIVPPPMRPDSVWCSGCRDWHPRDCFHKDSTRPNGLQSYCKDYRAAYRKVNPARTEVSWHWHRATK